MSVESRDNRILGRDMCDLIQHGLSMIQIEQCIHKKGFPLPHNETTITQSPSSIRLKIRIRPRCNFMQPQFERDLVRVCHSVLSQVMGGNLGVFKGARVGGFTRFPAVLSLPRIDPKAIYPASEAASAYASAPHVRRLLIYYSEWIGGCGFLWLTIRE